LVGRDRLVSATPPGRPGDAALHAVRPREDAPDTGIKTK